MSQETLQTKAFQSRNVNTYTHYRTRGTLDEVLLVKGYKYVCLLWIQGPNYACKGHLIIKTLVLELAMGQEELHLKVIKLMGVYTYARHGSRDPTFWEEGYSIIYTPMPMLSTGQEALKTKLI